MYWMPPIFVYPIIRASNSFPFFSLNLTKVYLLEFPMH